MRRTCRNGAESAQAYVPSKTLRQPRTDWTVTPYMLDMLALRAQLNLLNGRARATNAPNMPATLPLSVTSTCAEGIGSRDFKPLVSEATFYRVQAILEGRVVVSGPRPRWGIATIRRVG